MRLSIQVKWDVEFRALIANVTKRRHLICRSQEEQQIDRVAQEYTKLQHFVKKCVNHPFVEELKPVSFDNIFYSKLDIYNPGSCLSE